MGRRRYDTRRSGRRYSRRTARRYSRRPQGQPSLFWGRALMTVVVVFCIWAWAKGQPT